MLPKGDVRLVQILDAALADAAHRSGNWLVCKPGCTSCCVGAFAINRLDASRLHQGLENLSHSDPERAEAVRKRAQSSVDRLRDGFPGDPATGLLDDSDEAEALFEDFANDEPCPALDPGTGHCDLYQARPMTCRVFGPPVRSEQGLGVCELCYHGATEEQIATCEMVVDPEGLEATLLDELEEELEPSSAGRGRTLVAFALTAGTINS
jgi:Fe-S-cluster containining protein